jgi:hypothetical protein
MDKPDGGVLAPIVRFSDYLLLRAGESRLDRRPLRMVDRCVLGPGGAILLGATAHDYDLREVVCNGS